MSKKERLHCDIMAFHPEVTGTLFLNSVRLPNGNRVKFAVDCGLYQEPQYEELNYEVPFDPSSLQFVIVTHNHVDHIGRLPILTKNGFYRNIYVSTATSKLIGYALSDTYGIIKENAKRRKIKSLYSECDVDSVMRRIVPCEFENTFIAYEDEDSTIKVTFFKNGHLIGASLVLIQIESVGYESTNLLYSGDFNSKNTFFDVPELPDWVLDLKLTVVIESTYGSSTSDEKISCFQKNVLECVKANGTVIVPVFALGRTQEILYLLKCMQDEGSLSTDIPIYLDGKLALKYTSLYKRCELGLREELKDFLPKNLTAVDYGIRNRLIDDIDTKIILTTSGMGTHGPATQYIPNYLRRTNALIQFTGYVVEGWSRDLIEAEPGSKVKVQGVVLPKIAKVCDTSEFSGHARSDELIRFLQKFKNLRLVIINHGNFDSKQKFAETVYDNVITKDVCIIGRDYFYRVGSYGLVKAITTKFKEVINP